jgi:uroporphyrinogen decarboxylase
MRIAAFENRRRDEMTRLIEKHGGTAFVTPAMREVALEDNLAIVDFANRMITGSIDIIIFLTGVGFQMMLQAIERRVDRQRFLDSLCDITTIARGPKPAAAMLATGLTATHRVPEPNTWREVLDTVDRFVPVAGQNVVIQEYGRSNPSLLAGIEARGGRVSRLPIYLWALPEDTAPLESNLAAIAEGQRDIVLFTSAQQIVHALQLADQMGRVDEIRHGFSRCLIGSIGPTTSEALLAAGLPADFEPRHPKMGHLVGEAATASADLMARKHRVLETLSGPQSVADDPGAPWYDSPFLKACRREPTDRVPIWLMRQAGRYLKEYRDIRKQFSFLEMCKRPDVCAEIMIATVNRLGVDAAIIFSDLLPILEPMGMELEYVAGDGPVIHNPIRDSADVDRLVALDNVESLDFVCETVRETRAGLPADIPLIGFSGAPFTLASYAIEGGASRNYLHTKTLMRRDEGAWKEIMQRLARSIVLYLNAQISAGAQCVQVFDSWAGCLGTDDYRRYVLPYVCDVISGITPGVPVISFATGNPALLPCLAAARPNVVGVDWRIPLDLAWQRLGYECGVQGNLDPSVLLADPLEVRRQTRMILDQAGGRPGHIFNLGQGVLPQTPVDNVLALIDEVRTYNGSEGNAC